MVVNRQHFDLKVFGLQDNLGACDGEDTEPTISKSASDHDPLGLLHALDLRNRRVTWASGIIKEADETAGEIEDKAVLDAAIVANAQAVEHYEMCRYGTLIAWAEELGHDDIVRFLTTNLNEEKAANTKLNTVALRKGVNATASTAA
jgi:ferritin-like metal-binding protein YciE